MPLHFGRAAQRLGIAQPPLSRAIQRLERRLGAVLLDRTSRTVTLTEAGSVLLVEGRAALDAVEAAERRTRRAARAHVHLADITGLPGLPLPRWPGPDGTYPPGPGPQVRDHAQLLQLVALGRACAVPPESCRAQLHGDLAAVPVLDAPAVTTVIAWPPHSRSRAVADLVRTATRLR
ncbi:LysR family transcriptional regulator [Streptomyces sp. NPDC031705]|uniref:LysR family transcriptional regulator n=1 Tax=Streptomyces sp. NPDC031705 TaxID=3155729 RepID=UPI0033C9D58E